MFYLKTLKDTVPLKPSYIGANIANKILDYLKEKYERKIYGKVNGYVLSVVDVNEKSIKNGIVDDTTSFINYTIEYSLVLFIPEKGEYINVKIDYCSNPGLWGSVYDLYDYDKTEGYSTFIECFCPNTFMKKYKYNEITEEFEIKKQDLLKHDTKHDTKHEIIRNGSIVRMRIVSYKIDTNKMEILCEIP